MISVKEHALHLEEISSKVLLDRIMTTVNSLSYVTSTEEVFSVCTTTTITTTTIKMEELWKGLEGSKERVKLYNCIIVSKVDKRKFKRHIFHSYFSFEICLLKS